MAETISVNYMARVEGEGALTIRFKGDQAESVELSIFEPPRFFEALLVGRSQVEAPDITARICGICPVAYMMSACHAIEAAHGVELPLQLRKLRRLLYCGEWLESHLLHTFMLHAPDFMGYDDAIAMAKDHPELVKNGLHMKKLGNRIVNVLGGREIHPVNVKVGGFYRAPRTDELQALLPDLEAALDLAEQAVRVFATFSFPEFSRDYEFVALHHPDEYPFCEGRLISNRGLNIEMREYEAHFEESHVAHSTALHSRLRIRDTYLCGPLARVNLNYAQLSPRVRRLAESIDFEIPCLNPFKSIIARGLEVVQAFEEAARIIRDYTEPEVASLPVPVRAGLGQAITEAPRGILYHRYEIDEEGMILSAKIVPPTSQNQGTIEQDLFALAPDLAKLEHAAATALAEQAVRNYDPCISCSTHFLKLTREGLTE